MSSILKALKRLDEERAGRPAPAGGQFVLPPRRSRTATWLLLAGGIGVGLLLAAGGYVLLGGRQGPPTPVSVAQPPVVPLSAQPAAAPDVTGPAAGSAAPSVVKAQPAVVAAAPPPDVAKGKAAPPVSTPRRAVPAPPVAATPPVASAAPAAPPAARVAPVEQVQLERREIPAPGQQWAAPHLVVSEILPDGGGGYMAIVNGLPVMEGTMVEDALVKTIDAEKVLFVIDGKTVAVPLAARP